MADRKYYVRCENGCLFESLKKEQIYAAITQAVQTGTIGDVDTGFVQTVKTINGKGLKFFYGTQAEYEILTAAEKSNLFAIITNDTSKEAFNAAIESLQKSLDTLERGVLDGTIVAGKAQHAEQAQYAEQAQNAVEAENADKATNATNLVGELLFTSSAGASTGTLSKYVKDGDVLEMLVSLGAFKFFTKVCVKNGTGACASAFYVSGFGWRCADITINSNKFTIGTIASESGASVGSGTIYEIRRIRG